MLPSGRVSSADLIYELARAAETGPNWAEIVTAVGAALTGLGVVGVIVTAQEARRDRHVHVLSELADRWAGVHLEEARTAMIDYGAAGLQEKIEQWFAAEGADPEVELLLRVPNFYEDVAILVESGGLKFDLVWRSFAGPALGCWTYWEKAISVMQDKDAGAYVEYGKLVTSLRKRPMPGGRKKPVEQGSISPEGDGASQAEVLEKPSRLQSSGSTAGSADTGTQRSLIRFLLILVALSAFARLVSRFSRS